MDTNRSTRKRKQPSNPLHGILTRSKSQIYVHARRSGRSRSDLSKILKSELPRTLHIHRHHSRLPRPELNPHVDTPNQSLPETKDLTTEERAMESEIKTAYISTKDLRARRVFSKPLNNPSVELFDAKGNPHLFMGEFNFPQLTLDGKKSDCLGAVDEDLNSSSRNENKEVVLGFNREKEGLSGESPKISQSQDKLDVSVKAIFEEDKSKSDSSEKLPGLPCTVESSNYSTPSVSKKANSAGLFDEQQRNDSDPVLIMNVEGIQATPPDTNALEKLKGDQPVAASKMVLNGSSAVSERLNRNQDSKFALNPCSRLKLFKSAKSFSYKRLLPYLMDMANVKSVGSSLLPTCTQEIHSGDVSKQELQVSPCSKSENKDQDIHFEQSEASLSQRSSVGNQSPEKRSVESAPRSDCSDMAKELCKEVTSDSLKEDPAKEETTSSSPFKDIEATPTVYNDQSLMQLSVEQHSELHSSSICNSSPIEGSRQMFESLAKNMGTLRSELAGNHLHHADFSSEGGSTVNLSNLSISKQEERVGLSSEDQQNCPDHEQMTNEENIQTTPPDTNVLEKLEDNLSVVKTEEKMLPLDEDLKVFQRCSLNKKNGSNISTKLVLNYKTANSVSYRRLLPYLMDIAKDKPGVNCSKTENAEEKKPSDQAQASCPQQSFVHSPCLEKNPAESVPRSDSSEPADEFCKESTTCSLNENHATETTTFSFPMNDIQATLPLSDGDSQMKLEHSSPEVASEAEQKSEPLNSTACGSGLAEGSHQMSPSPAKDMRTLRRNLATDALQHGGSPSVERCGTNNRVERKKGKKGKKRKNCDDQITVFKSSSPVKAVCSSSEMMVVGETKGILKRNPRGCRGLCTCLYCSSFRLNAERAFEFSRNQMLDTQELVLHLVKELSRARNVLKKAAGDSDSDAIFQVNKVEEICEKAEDLAKTRLQEMNEDLSAHCRTKSLERPSVNFILGAQEQTSKRSSPLK